MVRSEVSVITCFAAHHFQKPCFGTPLSFGGPYLGLFSCRMEQIRRLPGRLVGQTVGSRVLLVIPPADGYGPVGVPSAGIKGTDPIVFAVDILAAASSTR